MCYNNDMAILEIEVAAEEQAQAQREAQQAGLSFSEWAKRRLFGPPPVTFTTDDGEVYEISLDLPQRSYYGWSGIL